MKISKLFHWLYAAVMMLPLFLFPIFALAVRSDNNYQPISIEIQEKVNVNFNQMFPLPNSDVFTVYSIGATVDYSQTQMQLNGATGRNGAYLKNDYRYNLYSNNKYLVRFDYQMVELINWTVGFSFNTQRNYIYLNGTNTLTHYENIFTFTENSFLLFDIFPTNTNQVGTIIVENINVFNLTQMYGVGNEPSLTDFNITWSDSYYEKVDSQKLLVNKPSLTTYNDSDVGSQMIYTAYRVVDNYFNYDNVFNFKDLYTWLETTYFSGTAPMGFFIFWHLLIYWLLTSLLWLLFDVLMYVPMLIHRWLDKAALS